MDLPGSEGNTPRVILAYVALVPGSMEKPELRRMNIKKVGKKKKDQGSSHYSILVSASLSPCCFFELDI